MKNQLLQGAVQVVGLGEPEAGAGLVDDAVFHLAIHPERDRDRLDQTQNRRSRHGYITGTEQVTYTTEQA